ncbi:MAG: hypothetical protein M0Z93_10240 [Actinomycetota bacterium]|jgi:hypothetical protein|nr:hypothetical protein [Actinomycetota bacterium]
MATLSGKTGERVSRRPRREQERRSAGWRDGLRSIGEPVAVVTGHRRTRS